MAFNFFDAVCRAIKRQNDSGVSEDFGIDVIGDIDDGTDALKNYLKSGYGLLMLECYLHLLSMNPTLGVSITDLGGTAIKYSNL